MFTRLRLRSKVFISVLLFGVSCNVTAKAILLGQAPAAHEIQGRTVELNKLESLFLCAQDSKTLTITGINGIGKTQLARNYANKHLNSYDFIIWVNSKNSLSNQISLILSSYAKLLQDDALPTSIPNDSNVLVLLSDIIERSNQKWLFIIDDAENQSEISSLLPKPESSTQVHSLITSQNSYQWECTLKLEALSNQDADSLLLHLSNEKDKKYSRLISQHLSNHPFALKLAGKYINETPSMNLEGFYHLLTTKGNSMFNGPLSEVKKTVSISLSSLKDMSKEAYTLAALCGFLEKDNIPHSLLLFWYNKHFGNDEVAFHEAMRLLSSYNFLAKMDNDQSKDVTNRKYILHDIIHHTIVDTLTKEEKAAIVNDAVDVLKSDFLKRDKSALNNSTKELIYHLISITSHAIKNSSPDRNLYSLMIDIIDHILITQRDYGWGKKHIDFASRHFDSCPFNDLKIKFYTNVGASNMTRSDYRGAVMHTKKAITLYESSSKEANSFATYIQAKCYHASSLAFLGEISKSQDIYEQLANLIENQGYDGGNNDPWPVFVNNVLHEKIKFDSLFEQGLYLEASNQMNLIFKVIDNFVSSQPEPIDDKIFLYFYTYQNLADLLAEKNLDSILPCAKKLWEKCLVDIDSTTPDTVYGMTLATLALAELKSGDIYLAKTHAKEALNILDKWFEHEKHTRDQAFVYIILAKIYQSNDEHEAAISFLKEAEKSYQNNLNNMEIGNVNTLYTLMIRSTSELGNEFATDHYTLLNSKFSTKQRQKIF